MHTCMQTYWVAREINRAMAFSITVDLNAVSWEVYAWFCIAPMAKKNPHYCERKIQMPLKFAVPCAHPYVGWWCFVHVPCVKHACVYLNRDLHGIGNLCSDCALPSLHTGSRLDAVPTMLPARLIANEDEQFGDKG